MKSALTSWATNAAAPRRDPTVTEMDMGFACGPADQALFNELMYRLAQSTKEMEAVILGAGITPSPNDLTQLKQAILALTPASPRGVFSMASIVTTSSAILTAAQNGAQVLLYGSGAQPVTLPSLVGLETGAAYHIERAAGGSSTITPTGAGNGIYDGANWVSSITLQPGDSVSLWNMYGSGWVATGPFVQRNVGGSSAGEVAFFARSAAPTGWLKASGAAISRSSYNNLFAAIGTTFGNGDGSTTFNVPDLRGEFLRGLDDGRGVDTARVLGAAQADELRAHTHRLRSMFSALATGAGYASISRNDGAFSGDTGWGAETTGGVETRPRNVALLACIRY